MKKTVCILLSFMLMISLCACGASTPKSAAKDFFKAIQSGDDDLLNKISFGDVEEGSLLSELLEIIESSEYSSKIGKALSKSIMDFDYTIDRIEEDGDNAVAYATIKIENWPVVLSKTGILIAAKSVSMFIDGASEKQIQKECKSIFEEQQSIVDDIEHEIEIPLVKEEGKWKIDLSTTKSVLNTLWGGLF